MFSPEEGAVSARRSVPLTRTRCDAALLPLATFEPDTASECQCRVAGQSSTRHSGMTFGRTTPLAVWYLGAAR